MILIATDLDRTLLPNGTEKDDMSLELFYKEIKKIKSPILVYVTGRNLQLFKDAQKEFPLIQPNYLIGSVGTEIYIKKDAEMVAYENYKVYLEKEHPNWNRNIIVEGISQNETMYLQEDEVQNQFKVSYYTRGINSTKKTIKTVKSFVKKNKIRAEVIYSFDPIKNIGLIDILPLKATKKGALEFLINELGITKEDAIFAGDSGNDLLALTSGIRSILVKNARDEVKKEAWRIAQKMNISDKLYIAKGEGELSGNYASGVLEGLQHFDIL